jgi:hypothetical protein
LECLRSCSTLFRLPLHKHRRRTIGWSALRIVLHPQLLSVEVRISRERGDFCSCLAVDFVRKTVYHRQASLCTWLESRTVTAKSSLPRSKTSRAQRIYTYIKDASRSMTPALATRIDEMPHLDRLRFKTTYVFLQLAVPSRQSLVLSQVLRPRFDDERFDVARRVLSIAINAPP